MNVAEENIRMAPANFTSSRSYWGNIKKRFKRNKRGMVALSVLTVLLFFFVFADFIANNKPLIAKYENSWHFPVINEYLYDLHIKKGSRETFQDWYNIDYDFVIWPPIPYSPKSQDINNISTAPTGTQDVQSLRWRHWLGTDDIGRDLLSAMIHATRIDLSVGIIAMGVAAFLGIFLGALAGFFADDRIRIPIAAAVFYIIGILLGYFYGIFIRSGNLSAALEEGLLNFVFQFILSILIFVSAILLARIIAIPFCKLPFLKNKIIVPFDTIISRLIEVVVSIPVLFLIIMILAVAGKGSILWVMVVIGLTRWTGIARLIRAELLKIRQLEYIEAAQALGFKRFRILINHAIPNALGPVFIAIAFGIAGAILIEAFLSFIGIGIPPDEQTWGSLLSQGRDTPRDWWMALFPGLAIFLTVTVFNLIGEALSDAMDPRQQ